MEAPTGGGSLTVRRRRGQRGAAAVEFALVLPLLLMILFGIITFGLLFAQDLALSNSARQVARYSVIRDRTCADVIAEAKDSAKPLIDTASADFKVTVKRAQNSTAAKTAASICGTGTAKPCAGSVGGDNIYVTLDYKADVLVPMIPGIGSTMDLNGKGVFRCEWTA